MFILLLSIIFSSCSIDSEARIIKKLEKHLDKYTGYKTDLKLKTIMNDKESQYKMKETYTLGNKYRLEILEPSESKGITIEYDGDKIYINHASLKQSITLNSVKHFDQGLLIGKFFREPNSVKHIDEEELDGEKYYVFRNKVRDKNKYSHEQVIWLKKKDFKPHLLKIIDSDGNPRAIVEYTNFSFTKD